MIYPFNFRFHKLKLLVVISAFIGTLYVFSKVLLVVKNNNIANMSVIVHIDLKGTPLKLSYLKNLLPYLKKHGANGLLMEYEDMFPYEGKLVNLSAENCYNKAELKEFLSLARDTGLEVIPLIQTFGHMEHVLKLEEFQHLREEMEHPDSICPSKTETRILLRDMLEQVMNFHSNVAPLKSIHIGCDEVFHINQCQQCVKRNLINSDLFLTHVKAVSYIVKSINPNSTVLIWDDMLRGIKPNKWKDVEHFRNTQPVYWDYEPSIKVSHTNLFKYHQKFQHLWIASAFKGADGRTAFFPDTRKRFLNLLDWMNFISGYRFGGERNAYIFKGIILTGWSRYSHMDPPCELLPAAIPSLIINLLLIKEYKAGIITAKWGTKHRDKFQAFVEEYVTFSDLNCKIFNNTFEETYCKFDGRVLYDALAMYSNLLSKLSKNARFGKDELGLDTIAYYSKHNFMNTMKAAKYRELIQSDIEALTNIERTIDIEMNKYYNKDFVFEYVNYKSYSVKSRLNNLLNNLHIAVDRRTWPRRTKNSAHYL